jgi:hypothetical protein
MCAIFVFTPSESKRLIAKAVARLPEVQKAKEEGEIVIGHGSTNVRVAEEILGACPKRANFISGLIVNGTLCVTQAEEKPPMIVLRKGKLVPPEATMEDVLQNFGADSVFIKGANAVDPAGNAGVFVAHPSGGTIGYAGGILSARGCRLIVPIGLEKLVPSIPEATRLCGQDTFYYSQGIRVGMVPLMNAKVVTEVEAFRILFKLTARQVGGGGLNGSEGSAIFVAEGKKEDLDQAIALIEGIKGEPPLRAQKSFCINCLPTTPSMLASPDQQFAKKASKHCMFIRKREEELPDYFQRRARKS